ncbi:hypothetical protein BGW38_006637 [Lunasporangiospora selenospora]|uniref:DASH complex subunit DAM1 n=1 Tax=Lunasporangiospora selenospora TaxID=979761 RepID=A0A9P6FZP1_9FUNG|nr:hypothetical protein BGW38_006637 [Lunasporangiospora selenospora]
MSQDSTNRRKSRIGPGFLLKRSTDDGDTNSSTAQGGSSLATDVSQLLFGSIRHASVHAGGSSGDLDSFRRSQQKQSYSHRSDGLITDPFFQQQQQQQQSGQHRQEEELSEQQIARLNSISKDVRDPVAKLSEAVDQLVDKMSVVSEIHLGLANFNESFGALLYGLKVASSNIEWTEAPTKESFERQEQRDTEVALLQKQQEELEYIRQQQLRIEREQEQARQQQEEEEAERLEAEHAKAEMIATRRASANPRNALKSIGNSTNASGNRMNTGIPRAAGGVTKIRRPTAGLAGKSASSTVYGGSGGGANQSRTPPRRVASTSLVAGPSRVGSGGQVRKMAGKLVMKRMADRLPIKYRDEPHRTPIEAIMRTLAENIEGLYLPEVVPVTNVPRHRCNEYLSVLSHAKEVVKSSGQKGVLFALNPDRYPSR